MCTPSAQTFAPLYQETHESICKSLVDNSKDLKMNDVHVIRVDEYHIIEAFFFFFLSHYTAFKKEATIPIYIHSRDS